MLISTFFVKVTRLNKFAGSESTLVLYMGSLRLSCECGFTMIFFGACGFWLLLTQCKSKLMHIDKLGLVRVI